MGLSDCHGGFGVTTTDNDTCNNGQTRGILTYAPDDHEAAAVINDMSLLLTGGRLNQVSTTWFKNAYKQELNSGGFENAYRLVKRLFLLTPEFHSTGLFKPKWVDRPGYVQPEQTVGKDYKAVVYLYLNGGMDGFNMLFPHSNCKDGKGKRDSSCRRGYNYILSQSNIFIRNIHHVDMFEDFKAVRNFKALDKGQLLTINAADSDQVCNTFGLHRAIPFLKQLYEDEDLAFLANVGLLNEPMTKWDWKAKTSFRIGAHNLQRYEMFKVSA